MGKIYDIIDDKLAACYGVPVCEFREPRDTLDRWAMSKGDEGLKLYRRENNVHSIDGLPGLEPMSTE